MEGTEFTENLDLIEETTSKIITIIKDLRSVTLGAIKLEYPIYFMKIINYITKENLNCLILEKGVIKSLSSILTYEMWERIELKDYQISKIPTLKSKSAYLVYLNSQTVYSLFYYGLITQEQCNKFQDDLKTVESLKADLDDKRIKCIREKVSIIHKDTSSKKSTVNTKKVVQECTPDTQISKSLQDVSNMGDTEKVSNSEEPLQNPTIIELEEKIKNMKEEYDTRFSNMVKEFNKLNNKFNKLCSIVNDIKGVFQPDDY